MEKSTFVIDIDDTISQTPINERGEGLYKEALPILNTIIKIRELHQDGHKIILFTARGMRTFQGNVEKIKEHHQQILVDWLKENQVPYDELIFGKPWGPNVYYVDDRSLTLDQFILHDKEYFPTILEKNSILKHSNKKYH